MEAVALWVNRKPNKEFDLQMTGSQEVLFWYERTIISLQFFINLILQKVLQNSGEDCLLWFVVIFSFTFNLLKLK